MKRRDKYLKQHLKKIAEDLNKEVNFFKEPNSANLSNILYRLDMVRSVIK